MNKDQIEGNWEALKGQIKGKWDKLTNDEVGLAKDKTQEFFGKVQAKYGTAKDEVEKNYNEMKKSCGSCSTKADAA